MTPKRGLWTIALALPLLAGCRKQERTMAAESGIPQGGDPARPAEALKSLGYLARGEGEGAVAASPPPQAEGVKPAADPREPAAALRKLIRRVELDLVVRDTERAAREAEALAERFEGFVEESSAQRSGDLMYYTMKLRVPEPRLGEALAVLKKGADRIDREQIGTEDVTSQYVDLTARMSTLKATEVELRALLAESRSRGRKVDEIMQVYAQLTEIRTQIEQIEGQVRAFDRLAALSTIQLRLSPTEAAKPVAAPGWHPLDTVRSAFRSLVALARGGVEVAIFLGVVVLPVIAVLWLLLKGALALLRRLRRRRE